MLSSQSRLCRIEVAGSGQALGCLAIPEDVLDYRTSCWLDLQALVHQYLQVAPDVPCFLAGEALSYFQVCLFDEHNGRELTKVDVMDTNCDAGFRWLSSLQNQDHKELKVVSVSSYDYLDVSRARLNHCVRLCPVYVPLTFYSFYPRMCFRYDVVQAKHTSLEELPRAQDDFVSVLNAVTQHGMQLFDASARLRDNEIIVAQAVTNCGRALEFASSRLQQQEAMVLLAAKTAKTIGLDVPQNLKTCRDFALKTVQICGKTLPYFRQFCCDREVVTLAVRQDPRALIYADSILRNDPELVKLAIELDAGGMCFVGGGG